jgi:hypothetical protein
MKKIALSWLALVFKAWSKGRLPRLTRPLPVLSMTGLLTWSASAGDFIFDNAGVTIGDAVTTNVAWSTPNIWNPDGASPSGLFDNIVLNATSLPGTANAGTVLNLDVLNNALALNAILQTGQNATNPDNVTINLVSSGTGTLQLHQILKSAGGVLQIAPTVPVASVVSATNPTGSLIVTNTDNSAIQLQGSVTTAGDLIRNGTGGGFLRLGITTSTHTNAISGNIVINAGSIELASNNAGNVAGGSGRAIIMNSPNGTINFRPQVSMDYGREIDLNAYRTTFSADRSAGTNTGQTVTTGTINVNRNDAYLILNSGNTFGYQFDGINLGSNTLNIRNGLNGGAKAGTGVLSGSGTIHVSGSGDNNTAGLNFNAASPGFSGTVRFYESIGSTISTTGALGSGMIILGADSPTAPVTYPNADIGSASPAVRSQAWSAGLNYNANNPTTGPVAVEVYGGSSVNMGVVPTATDVIRLREHGIIQGNDAELSGFTVGGNLLLPAQNAIIAHEVINGANPTGIGTGANHFYGMAVDHLAGTSLTVGAGTPWRGVSNDRFARTLGGAGTTLTINGGDSNPATVEATILAVNGKGLNLFTGGGTWLSGNAQPVTVEIAGARNPFNNVTGTGSLGGTVLFQSDAATSGLSPAVVDKLIVSGTLQAQNANMFGGVPVEVLNGGGIDPGNANTFDTNVTFQSGGRLLHNDNMLFTGSGTLTFNGGSHFYIVGNAPANTLTGSTQPLVVSGTGHTLRVGVNEVVGLDAAVPDTGANWEFAAASTTSAPAGTTLTGIATLTQTAGITTNGGYISNDQGGSRAFVGPVNIGNNGATLAATTGTSVILMNAVNAGGGNAPLQIGSATPLNNINKIQQQVAVSNNDATLNTFSGSTAVIFEGGLKSGTVNVVQHDLYLDGDTANTQINGDINLGEFSRLYLGGGGSINTGNAFGGALPRRGDLTPNIINGTVATGTINMGNYTRIEMAVDHIDPAYTASLVGGRSQVQQSFTVAPGADLNPQDRRNLWIDRGANTTITAAIDLNNVNLGNGSNLAIQESGTDIRATLNLTGANAIVSPGNGTAWDLKNINNVGGGAKSIALGRMDQPHTEFGIFGNVGSEITINNVNSRLAVRPGATIAPDFVFNDAAASRTPFNFLSTTPGGTNNGSDHTLSIVTGSNGVAASYLNTGTFNSNAGNAWGFYVQDNAAAQVRNEVGSTINLNSGGGTLFSDRDGADAAFNGVVKLNTVNLNAPSVTLGTRNFTDLEIGTLNVTQNAVVKSDGGRTDGIASGNGAVRIGNVAAGANDVQFQNGRTTITGNVTVDVLTAGGTSLEFNPGGSGTSTVSATSVRVNSLLAARSGTTSFGTAILQSQAAGTTVAGLREGVIAGNAINVAGANPAGNAATANSNDGFNLGIRMDPRVGQTNASTGGTQDTARGWGDNQTWVYSGQIFDADGIFTLAENIDDSVQIVVDGQVRLFNRNTTSVVGGTGLQQQGPFESWRTITSTASNDGLSDGYKQPLDGEGALSAGLGDLTVRNVNDGNATMNFGMGPGGDGWHDIEIRIHNGGGGAGPVAALGWGNYFALGLNPDGTTSLVGTDFIKPGDNGSMNLFRTTTVAKGNVDIDGGALVNAGGVQTIGTVAFGRNGTGSAQLNLSGGNASDTDVVSVLGSGRAAGINLAAATDTLTTGKLNVGVGNTFTKSGSGLLTVTGAADAGNTGDIFVTGGELRVNGTVLGGVTTSGGGILSGIGTVAGGVSLTGSTISPGDNNLGTFNVTGAISLDSSSLVLLTINDEAPGGMDVINNTGSFSAGGAFLSVTFNDVTFTAGTTAGDLPAATRYEFVTGPTDPSFFGNSTPISAVDLAVLGLSAGEREINVGGTRFWLESGSWSLVPINPIPEPGTAALAAAASLLLLNRRRRRA